MRLNVPPLIAVAPVTTTEPVDAVAVLRDVKIVPRVVQEFRPLCESLEWELSELYWRTAGLAGFLQNEVPYTINNSGLLSGRAAELLVASCAEAPPSGTLTLLEVGAGTGLFARYLLDELLRLDRRDGLGIYDRVTFYVTDRSARTVEQWREQRVFAGHEAHVVLATCDALRPEAIQPFSAERGGETAGAGTAIALAGLRAVFANYVLDSLPSTVVRKGAGRPLELFVRTHLTSDSARLAQYTELGLQEIRALAESARPEDRRQLIPLISVLEFETAFLPCPEPRPFADEALAVAHEADRAILNHGAMQSIERCLGLLDPAGFMLLNDYGCLKASQMPEQAATQRFGASAALGLNFPLLEHAFRARGHVVMCPEEDSLLPVHPRLIAQRELPRTRNVFMRQFGGDAHRAIEGVQERARASIEAGHFEQAKVEYQTALERQPRDWRLLGEIAEFLIRQVADYESAHKLVRMALERNPWSSAWLWNVLGDALFSLDRFAEAHEAYLRARDVDGADARTHLNLAYTHAWAGNQGEALDAIARGLTNDRTGAFRGRLLEKQQQVLGFVTAKYLGEQEWLARRAARLLQPQGP